MIELSHYANAFSNLHTAKMKGHKAPHKAMLLLSIIDLVEEGTIASPRIYLSDELIDRFNKVWHHKTILSHAALRRTKRQSRAQDSRRTKVQE